MVFINVVGLIVYLQSRTDRLLGAVVDPLHPDWAGMQRAFAGFAIYAVSLVGALLVGALILAGTIARKTRKREEHAVRTRWARAIPPLALAGGLTALIVLALIEVLLFQDYGIHLYEFDVFSILADAALRRDLGIQPAEVLRVTIAALALLGAELLLCAVAVRLVQWRDGAMARACGAAMLVGVPGGLMVFRSGEEEIASDRAEFIGALPLGRQLLLRASARPFIPVTAGIGGAGYPVVPDSVAAPALARKTNVVFWVADGLRGDMFTPELTPNLWRFGARTDAIQSGRHFSTGHVSEAGIFGLLYALRGQAFHAFMESRIPPYPLEVLKRNGYHTFLLASSRLSPYPSDQLIQSFDEVAYPSGDDEAITMLARFIDLRRTDGKPYFVLGFFYTPHYPFTSAKPAFRKYPSVGPKARTNYMNDVLQADDFFGQTWNLVRDDFEAGRTLLMATSDHGEEIRDHGVFGHASATFWNEKIVVPFVLGMPKATLSPAQRSAELTSHADVWPTIFDYLGLTPAVEPEQYSDGRSLLRPAASPPQVVVTGRFFPYADRPSVLVDGATKYWFRVDGLGANGRLCIVVIRATDLSDRALSIDPARIDARMVPAFERLQATFWHFIRPIPSERGERRIC